MSREQFEQPKSLRPESPDHHLGLSALDLLKAGPMPGASAALAKQSDALVSKGILPDVSKFDLGGAHPGDRMQTAGLFGGLRDWWNERWSPNMGDGGRYESRGGKRYYVAPGMDPEHVQDY